MKALIYPKTEQNLKVRAYSGAFPINLSLETEQKKKKQKQTSDVTSKQAIQFLLPYFWPSGRPGIRARVVLCIFILILCKLVKSHLNHPNPNLTLAYQFHPNHIQVPCRFLFHQYLFMALHCLLCVFQSVFGPPC